MGSTDSYYWNQIVLTIDEIEVVLLTFHYELLLYPSLIYTVFLLV